MAWTAPMTAVANAFFTSADYNTNVRDNLLETMPAIASTPTAHFVGTGPNKLIQRTSAEASVDTLETTTNTNWTNLSTNGPLVDIVTGSVALVCVTARTRTTTAGAVYASVEVTNSSNISASEDWAASTTGVSSNGGGRISNTMVFGKSEPALTPGTNRFRMRYRVTSGTGEFAQRSILVIAF